MSFVFFSCIKTSILENGVTRVPFSSKFYNIGLHESDSLFRMIDTNVVYEEYLLDKDTLARLHPSTIYYKVFRFYRKGKFNCFVYNKNKTIENNSNPFYNGYRGVIYVDKSRLRYDLFTRTNGIGTFGKTSGVLKFKNDTLYIQRDASDGKWLNLYIKRQLTQEELNVKTDW